MINSLVPAASHSAANCSSVGGHGVLKPTQPQHLQKAEKQSDLRSPSWTLSSPQLCLEILSMNITDRIIEKGQPWRSTTPTENESDLLPRIQTQLSQWLYKGPMANSNSPGGTPYSCSMAPKVPQRTRSQVYSKSTKNM